MRRRRKLLRPLAVHPESESWLPLVVDSAKTPSLEPGQLLRMIRTNLRMTQGQLSQRSGIDQAHITRMEAGKVDAQWKTWSRLFEAMGCRLALRVQAEGGLERIVEDRVQQTARKNVIRVERMYPDKPLSDAERQEEKREWIEIIQERHTPEIWDEEEPPA